MKLENTKQPWFFLLVFFLTKHAIISIVTVVMITMTHATTGIPTVKNRSDQLVGNSVVGNSVGGNSVVGTTVIDDVMMELIKGQLPPT